METIENQKIVDMWLCKIILVKNFKKVKKIIKSLVSYPAEFYLHKLKSFNFAGSPHISGGLVNWRIHPGPPQYCCGID